MSFSFGSNTFEFDAINFIFRYQHKQKMANQLADLNADRAKQT
ncbi:hypothetical protein HDC92_004554 [Pedobacter sp. AK017]|uniref:Uncharacterized protein n=1 Tax=Pedobacter heparinus (strain ATCC 13125 / DSM 2366 / CIP 104194 / JCM 7457 / NBRC 12017 / NCIMB 9290 / NRRL B-14731 / HIM 762-3) TaxID=485917 RepID=C6XTA4_PEDHD|nr:hypothetical protein Phep_3491 [Pedobacter heparinus DSM 2366]MBB5440850.1 hypothetical protein [Pedobacter sp. AK017]